MRHIQSRRCSINILCDWRDRRRRLKNDHLQNKNSTDFLNFSETVVVGPFPNKMDTLFQIDKAASSTFCDWSLSLAMLCWTRIFRFWLQNEKRIKYFLHVQLWMIYLDVISMSFFLCMLIMFDVWLYVWLFSGLLLMLVVKFIFVSLLYTPRIRPAEFDDHIERGLYLAQCIWWWLF